MTEPRQADSALQQTGPQRRPTAAAAQIETSLESTLRRQHLQHLRVALVALTLGRLASRPGPWNIWGLDPSIMNAVVICLILTLLAMTWHRNANPNALGLMGVALLVVGVMPKATGLGGLSNDISFISLASLMVWAPTLVAPQHMRAVLIFASCAVVGTAILEQLGVTDKLVARGGGTWEPASFGQAVALLYLGLGTFLLIARLVTTQALLREETSRALRAEAAESRFLANMSHEIRNPLNGMMGLLRHMSVDSDIHRIHQDSKDALMAADVLLRVVNDALDFKSLESGALRLRPEPTDLHKLVKSLGSFISSWADDTAIEWCKQTNAEPLPQFVLCDGVRIMQIAWNLVSNAFKFTHSGSVTTNASYNYSNGTLRFEVTDTGPGMSDDVVAELFKPFHQSDARKKANFGSTGLGLAITKQLVEQMGGTITVSSTPGVGSAFTVIVPMPITQGPAVSCALIDPHTDNSAAGRWPNRATSAEVLVTPLTGHRLLVVDDDIINLKAARRGLEMVGAEVVLASSAQEALHQLAKTHIDAVITDISMPGMDGEDLLAAVQRTHPELPVAALTGNVLAADVERYLNLGFATVLEKPLDPRRLSELGQIISGSTVAETLPAASLKHET